MSTSVECTEESKQTLILNQNPNESSTFYEGRLFNCFLEALTKTLEKYTSFIKFDLFKEKYPDIYKVERNSLKNVHEELMHQLPGSIKDQIDILCQDQNLQNLLNFLDNITKTNMDKTGQVAWRPSGIPAEDLRDHLYPSKVKHKEVLKYMLEKCSSENMELEQKLFLNHEEILSITGQMNELCEEIKNIMVIPTEEIEDGLYALQERN